MDFFNDLKQIVLAESSRLGIPHNPNLGVAEMLLTLLNYQLKRIEPKKRQIHASIEFNAALQNLSAAEQSAANAIKQKFADGQDVDRHLSKGTDPNRSQEVDQLRADWGIYHLHISNHKSKPSDYFFARTGPVMFVRATDTDAYFIDIDQHGGWIKQSLLRIIEKEWPNLHSPHKIKEAKNLTMTPSDADIAKFRGPTKKAGKPGNSINTVLQVGTSFLVPPGGGLALDGTPIANVLRKNQTIRLVRKLEAVAKIKTADWKAEISKRFGVAEAELDFELVAGFGIREKKTGFLVYAAPK